MIKARLLTKVELKLISISELFHQQRIEKPYGWKAILINAIIISSLWVYAIYKDDFSGFLIAFIVSALIIWFLWLSYKDFKEDIAASKKIITYIK